MDNSLLSNKPHLRLSQKTILIMKFDSVVYHFGQCNASDLEFALLQDKMDFYSTVKLAECMYLVFLNSSLLS